MLLLNAQEEPTETSTSTLNEKPDLFNYMVQAEVGARRNLRCVMANSAFGDTRVAVTLRMSGTLSPKVHEACAYAGGGHEISWWITQWKLR